MPLRPVMRHLSEWVDRIPDWEPGTEPGVMDVALPDGRQVRLGLGICFEVVVDAAVRDAVAGGAELLVVPTSNAWFGEGDEVPSTSRPPGSGRSSTAARSSTSATSASRG
ncbi:hypothetical protein BJF82_16495 [Kytococcus sp. CUA-901]|nr:hypothetical protein BJF82_16495 [Kytococcus sp. CUA-901]